MEVTTNEIDDIILETSDLESEYEARLAAIQARRDQIRRLLSDDADDEEGGNQ